VDLLDFHTQVFGVFIQNVDKNQNHPVSSSVLMREVKGELTDWLQLTERLQSHR